MYDQVEKVAILHVNELKVDKFYEVTQQHKRHPLLDDLTQLFALEQTFEHAKSPFLQTLVICKIATDLSVCQQIVQIEYDAILELILWRSMSEVQQCSKRFDYFVGFEFRVFRA